MVRSVKPHPRAKPAPPPVSSRPSAAVSMKLALPTCRLSMNPRLEYSWACSALPVHRAVASAVLRSGNFIQVRWLRLVIPTAAMRQSQCQSGCDCGVTIYVDLRMRAATPEVDTGLPGSGQRTPCGGCRLGDRPRAAVPKCASIASASAVRIFCGAGHLLQRRLSHSNHGEAMRSKLLLTAAVLSVVTAPAAAQNTSFSVEVRGGFAFPTGQWNEEDGIGNGVGFGVN